MVKKKTAILEFSVEAAELEFRALHDSTEYVDWSNAAWYFERDTDYGRLVVVRTFGD